MDKELDTQVNHGWLEDTIAMCWYSGFWNTPNRINDDSQYFPALKKAFDFLLFWLEKNKAPQEIQKYIAKILKILVCAIDDYYHGKLDSAQELISKLVCDEIKRPLFVSTLSNSCSFWPIEDTFTPENNNICEINFFRARNGTASLTKDIESSMHIPFDMRNKITSQRFNVQGLPCLYLGTSSYCCWIEMDRPADHLFNVAGYKIIDKTLKILNLSLPILKLDKKIPKQSINDLDFIKGAFLQGILTSATSFIVKNSTDSAFRSEYIVSQLLMQAALNCGIDAVAYPSKKTGSDSYSSFACMNLAVFAKYNSEKKYSATLRNMRFGRLVNYSEFKQLNDKEHYISYNGRPKGKLHVDKYSEGMVENSNVLRNYKEVLFHAFDYFVSFNWQVGSQKDKLDELNEVNQSILFLSSNSDVLEGFEPAETLTTTIIKARYVPIRCLLDNQDSIDLTALYKIKAKCKLVIIDVSENCKALCNHVSFAESIDRKIVFICDRKSKTSNNPFHKNAIFWDFENMVDFEKKLFNAVIAAVENGNKLD